MKPLVLLMVLVLEPEAVPGYVPPPDTRAHFEALARRRRASTARERPPRPAPIPLDGWLPARLEAAVDGWVRFSVWVPPASRLALERQGVPRVEHLKGVGDDALVGDRLHRTVRLGPMMLDGTGRPLFERWIGDEAEILLGRSPLDDHLEVVDIRRDD